MKLFDFLSLHYAEIVPTKCKLHLATWNGHENPLNVYFEGRFEKWQTWQNKKNFERDFIISLIKLSGNSRWLFVGVFRSLDKSWVTSPQPGHWSYETEELEELNPLAGRLIIEYKRTGRAPYLNADRWSESLVVKELLAERMTVSDFPGYRHVLIDKSKLDLIIRKQVPSWKGALSAVAGVYLITDTKTGRHYVGSATGSEGLWGRWSDYSVSGHGGDIELRKLLKAKGAEYALHFQFSVLEIADTHASKDEVIDREAHWKRALGSREFGYNAN